MGKLVRKLLRFAVLAGLASAAATFAQQATARKTASTTATDFPDVPPKDTASA